MSSDGSDGKVHLNLDLSQLRGTRESGTPTESVELTFPREHHIGPH